MYTFLSSLVVLSMMVVISSAEIKADLAPGTPAAEVKRYFEEIETELYYVNRDNPQFRVPDYPWLESDKAYYVALVRGVRSKWWLPSFGAVIQVFIGISSDGTVSQVVTFETRTGVL